MPLRILAIGPQDVCPPIDGGKEGIHGALTALAAQADLSYAYPCAAAGRPSAELYRALRVRPLALARVPRETIATVLGATLRGEPFKFAKYATREIALQLQRAVAGQQFDVILCFHAHTVGLAESLQRMNRWHLPIIVREHNIEYELVESYRRTLGPAGRVATWPFAVMTRREERSIWKRVDATAFLTDRDLAVARAAGCGGHLVLAPEGIPLPAHRQAIRPTSGLQLLLLLNQRATQSVGSMRKFLHEHWSYASAAQPMRHVSLVVTGLGPTRLAELSGLTCEQLKVMRVRALGFLPSLSGVFASSLALVSPTFVGGGIRKKVLEAMANQLPVIATPLDVDSCSYFDPPRNILRFATPAEFVSSVEQLTSDEGLWMQLSDAGRRTVERHASWSSFADVIIGEAMRLTTRHRSAATAT